MRNTSIGIMSVATAVSLLASAALAQAAVVTRFVQSGESVTLSTTTSVPGSGSGCTIDTLVNLTAATTVTRANGTSGSALVGTVQRNDSCLQLVEFGSFDVPLTAQTFQIDGDGASLHITVPVSLAQFWSDGLPRETTVTRTLKAALEFADIAGDSTAVRTRGRVSTPDLKLTTRGTSVLGFAVVTGQLLLDGTSVFTPDTSFGFLERSTTSVVEMTR